MLSRSFLAAVALLYVTVPAHAQADRELLARSCFICDAGIGVRAITRDAAGRYYVLTAPGPAVLIYGADGKRTGQLPAQPTKENSIVFGDDLVFDSSGRLVGTAKTNRKGPQARHCDLGLTQEGDWYTNAKLKSEIPGEKVPSALRRLTTLETRE